MNEVVVLRLSRRHSLKDLSRLAGPCLEAAGARRAIAFGSYARGTQDGYSDLDLVVVMRTELPFIERGRLLLQLLRAFPVPVDLLVYTPEEYARGMARGYGIFHELAREGVTIFERPED